MKDKTIYKNECYRILEVLGDFLDYDILLGDSFCSVTNPDLDPDYLETEKRRFIKRIDNDGVYGYILEKWNPEIDVGWENIDSMWGFVGRYDPTDSETNHYIVDEFKRHIATND